MYRSSQGVCRYPSRYIPTLPHDPGGICAPPVYPGGICAPPVYPGGYTPSAPWWVYTLCTLVGYQSVHHGGVSVCAPWWVCQPCYHGGMSALLPWWEERYPGIMREERYPGIMVGGVPRVYHRVYLGGCTASLLCLLLCLPGCTTLTPVDPPRAGWIHSAVWGTVTRPWALRGE